MNTSDGGALRAGPLVVFVNVIELQCCGDSFPVEQRVRWQLHTEQSHYVHWAEAVGDHWTSRLTHTFEGAHGCGEPDINVDGLVRAIYALTCTMRPILGQCRSWEILPGSVRSHCIAAAYPWAFERPDDKPSHGFVGWIVELGAFAGVSPDQHAPGLDGGNH